MTISIRVAQISDAERIADLTSQLGYEVDMTTVIQRLSRILSRSDHQFMIAELDGRLRGWVHAAISEYIESERFVTIGGLVVDKYHRKQGIGRRLMEQIEAWAREQGCSIVRLWSSSTRTSSHKFYEGLGYTNIKTQYSFIKSLDADQHQDVRKFVPKVDQ
jgi:N-acetylglutamate synthase-like GNAT family acetyltransferase